MLLPEDKSEIIFVSKKILENTDTFKIPEGIQTFTIGLGKFTNIKNDKHSKIFNKYERRNPAKIR